MDFCYDSPTDLTSSQTFKDLANLHFEYKLYQFWLKFYQNHVKIDPTVADFFKKNAREDADIQLEPPDDLPQTDFENFRTNFRQNLGSEFSNCFVSRKLP